MVSDKIFGVARLQAKEKWLDFGHIQEYVPLYGEGNPADQILDSTCTTYYGPTIWVAKISAVPRKLVQPKRTI